jgi:NAD(P)-dependent dehydrogenase (short-subunit alcohol dehydrogenase family)
MLVLFSGLWGIVNNAGIAGSAGLIEWLSRDDYRAAFEVSFKHTALRNKYKDAIILPVNVCIFNAVYFVLCLVYLMLSVSLCCSFLIVPSVYSSVYFVLCLVYPMLSVSLCCSFLIVPSVYSSEGQSRMNNTETLTTSDT